MFTGIHLKNFKLYRDVRIDLRSRKLPYKPVIIFYGESGSGKTTIAQAFYTLQRTMKTMELKGMLKDLLDKKLVPPEDSLVKPEALLSFLKTSLENDGIESIIRESKTIGSDENMSLEYEFVIDGKPGSYLIEMDDSCIIRERLEYCINKNRGCYVEIDEDHTYINEKIFETKEFIDDMNEQIEMYWGKHSFLSILLYQMSEKADTYINSSISMNLMNLLIAFQNIAYDISGVAIKNGSSIEDSKLLSNLEKGEVSKAEKSKLQRVEELLSDFFTSMFKDVKKVYYEIDEQKNKLKYRLFFTKHIGDYRYNIPFGKESRGTREVLNLLPFLMEAVSGKTVIIDEFGIGMHDLLAAKLLEIVAGQIEGQLIIMTHNTMIMDRMNDEHTKINPEALYFIGRDQENKKVVQCVTDIEARLHPNYNYRNRYITNPLYQEMRPEFTDNIDVSELAALYKV